MKTTESATPARGGPAWSRSDFLFALTALTVLAGLLIPWPARFLDALWIVCLCLTVSVLLICRTARSSSQLEGFPALAASAGLLAILLTAAGARLIIFQHSSGLLVLKVGRLFAAAGDAGTPILLVLVGLVLTFTVCYSAFRIRKAIEDYLFKVLPFKRAGLETDRTLRVLTEEKALALEEKIRQEAGFFASMGGVGFLFNALMICSVLLVTAAFLLVWILDIMSAASAAASPLRGQAVAPLAGTAILSWAALSSIVPACAALLNKKSFALTPAVPDQPEVTSRKVFVISPDTGKTEEVELLNPDFTDRDQPASAPAHQEQVAEFEPPQTEKPQTLRRIEIPSKDVQAYYQALSRLILHPQLSRPLVLLASETKHDLPVTVAVHSAVLTARHKKVLLVDADPRRRAVAQVFQVNSDKAAGKIQKTKIQGLSVFVPKDPRKNSLDFLKTLGDAASEFDHILLYAPEFNLTALELQARDLLLLYFTEADTTPLPKAMAADPHPILSLWPVSKAVSNS